MILVCATLAKSHWQPKRGNTLTVITQDGEVQLDLKAISCDGTSVTAPRTAWKTIELAVRKHKQVSRAFVDTDGWLHVFIKTDLLETLTASKLVSTLRSIETGVRKTASDISQAAAVAVS